MACFDHWHPVLLSRNLKKQPVSVRLLGQEIALFRTAEGKIGALEDLCPHRRMRLGLGKVVGERLQCRYHGWTFSCEGQGESPGTPKLHACVKKFDVLERHGAVWVKQAGRGGAFPLFEIDGYYNVCNLHHTVAAPLELVVDNFCEIEHTPTTHAFFGYPLERMQEVQVEFHATDKTVRVINRGPGKKIAWPLRVLLGIKPRYHFLDDWTTHFSPVYSVYDHWWADPDSDKESWVRWRLFIFFVPLSNHETALFSFTFTKSRWPGPAGCVRPFKDYCAASSTMRFSWIRASWKTWPTRARAWKA
jgi:phenylpropionate dioxygenase-like ring-hydroxylating dioxygenase large terminal subunit